MASLLVGDNSEVLVAGLEDVLQGAGHRVLARCFSAHEVLRAGAELWPEILILGESLLYQGRFDLLSDVKASQETPRVILLLTDNAATNAKRLNTANAEGFLLLRASVRR